MHSDHYLNDAHHDVQQHWTPPVHDLEAHVHAHHGTNFDGTMTPMNIYGSIGLLAILVYLYWTIFLKDGNTKKYNRRGEATDEGESLKAFNKKN